MLDSSSWVTETSFVRASAFRLHLSPHASLSVKTWLREACGEQRSHSFLPHLPGLSKDCDSLVRRRKLSLLVFKLFPLFNGKTRDLLRDTKGTFHAKMGSIKDRNGRDLTEAEDIKKSWQEYPEELYK